jgi:hypothetical protein
LVSYVILAEVSTLTFASGMVVWVLAFPLFPLLHEWRNRPCERKKTFAAAVAVGLCAIAGIGSYFVDYESAPTTWPEGVGDFLGYLTVWIGASVAVVGDTRASELLGWCLLLVGFLSLCVAVGEAAFGRTTVRLEWSWPWLMLVVYIFVSGVINTFSRIQLGTANAAADRYFLITIQLAIGLVGLLPVLLAFRADGRPRFSRTIVLACLVPIYLGGIAYALASWPRGIDRSNAYHTTLLRYRLALSLWREAPFISPLPISDNPPPPRHRTQYLTLVDNGLLPDLSEGRWLNAALNQALSHRPVGEVHVTGRGSRLRIGGWAIDPVSHTPFPAVLVAVRHPDGGSSQSGWT